MLGNLYLRIDQGREESGGEGEIGEPTEEDFVGRIETTG